MARPADTMDTRRFSLLARLTRRVAGGHVPDEVRRAVDVMTAAADPDRADRLAVQPGEPAVLVERLAVWALRRTTEDAVATATRILDGAGDRLAATSRPGRGDPGKVGSQVDGSEQAGAGGAVDVEVSQVA